MEAFCTIFTFPVFSQKGLTPRFNGTQFLRLEIYLKEMAKLQFLRIFEKATFFKAKRVFCSGILGYISYIIGLGARPSYSQAKKIVIF